MNFKIKYICDYCHREFIVNGKRDIPLHDLDCPKCSEGTLEPVSHIHIIELGRK